MVSIGSASRSSQLGLSICAAVAATLLVTGLQHQVAGFRSRPAAMSGDLTSGGKFAARVEALRASPDAPAILPPPVPLLAADAAMQALPASFAPLPAPALAEIGKVVKRSQHPEAHRRPQLEAARDVVPPKRGEHLADVAPGPAAALVAESGGDNAIWSATKGVYRQAVALGGTALDRINPLNLIP